MTQAKQSGHSFIPGLQLSELLYQEAVKPLLTTYFPVLPYSAALLGPGSEVLGFDTAQSTDHDWGPRLLLFLRESDHQAYGPAIDQMLRKKLPSEIHGYPIDYAKYGDDGKRAAEEIGAHSVRILTVRGFFRATLNFDPTHPPSPVEWMTFPEQILRSVTAGRVFHDGLGQLAAARTMLHYYPHDVWLYLLACQWRRLAQEQAFMGRCGQVGDELGSRLVAARLVRDLMKLGFLMERQYAPYMKWFGTAFAQLRCAAELGPLLLETLAADQWQAREKPLSAAYELMARLHNDLGITQPLPTQVSFYYDRPFLVIQGDNFAQAIHAAITGEEVRALPANIGALDQFIDSTDVLSDVTRFRQLAFIYDKF